MPGRQISKAAVSVSLSQRAHDVISDILKEKSHLKNNRTAALELALEAYATHGPDRSPVSYSPTILLDEIQALIRLERESESSHELRPRLLELETKISLLNQAFRSFNHIALSSQDIYRIVGFTPPLFKQRDIDKVFVESRPRNPVDVSGIYIDDLKIFAERLTSALRTERRLIRRISTYIDVCCELKEVFDQLNVSIHSIGIVDYFALMAILLQATGHIKVVGFPGTNRPPVRPLRFPSEKPKFDEKNPTQYLPDPKKGPRRFL